MKEPDSARRLTGDVREQFNWYLTGPVFSRYVGSSAALFRLSYVEPGADFWRETREVHETVVLSEENVYMVGRVPNDSERSR